MNVFIGYDRRQPLAFHVAAHSVLSTAFRPVSITALVLSNLPIQRRGLTEFTYSRFLVPYLSGFSGYSLFMDSDTLCRSDVHHTLAYTIAYPTVPVFVVTGSKQYEWPSVMLFNNALCANLTPPFINDTKNALFDFAWASSIGELPAEWNHLVGYDPPNPNASLVHFTQGVPCWPETQKSEFADEWKKQFAAMNSTVSFADLMGNSVHAAPVYERLKQEQCLAPTI